MATTLMSKAGEYFASLNPLAKKIGQDMENLQRRYGEESWAKLTDDQQEDLLNKFFVDIGIAEKYDQEVDNEEERPDCFPKLMIPCGEKICVDFDNDVKIAEPDVASFSLAHDYPRLVPREKQELSIICTKQGWTWRDEHSGPFSWMTRSQQDLAMYEDEDEGIEDDSSDTNKNGGTSSKSTPLGTPKRPTRKTNKSQSPRPDSKGSLAYKPEKSIWDSPFLAADRGLDSAYPSSHSSDQSKGSDESDHGDMINKFGMAAAFSNAVREAEEAERRSASGCSGDAPVEKEKEEPLHKLAEQPKRQSLQGSPERASSMSMAGQTYKASPSKDSISSSGSGRSSHSSRKKSTSKAGGASVTARDKRWKPSCADRKPEAERALMSELSVSVGSSIGAEEEGAGVARRSQVSPVFIEEPGESSSDFNVSVNSNAKFLFQDMKRERPSTAPPPRPSTAPPPRPSTAPPPPPAARADTSLVSSDSGNYSTPSSGQVNFAMDERANHSYDECEELDDWKVDLFSSSGTDDGNAPKSGFDFLDNW